VVNRRLWRELVSAYIFISHSQRQLMQHLDLPSERVFVKHNLVPGFPGDGPPPERAHGVVYLGRLDMAKGIQQLMAAWDLFRSQRPGSSLKLGIAGGGPLERDVRAWAATRAEVTWAGRLDRAEASDFLRRSLAAVVPSVWEETFGLVAVEAMSLGVPPIAPARGSFPELIVDGVDGLLYRPADTVDLARVLTHVDEAPEWFEQLGTNAHAKYQAQFQPERSVEDLLQIYRFAIATPAHREQEPAR
jgi:glycosyltransferase involved in cell wall biosynthesis